MVNGLIYPVPNPEFPFLGVHFTRTVHGEVEAGPNAVLAFAREGYSITRVNPKEMLGTLGYRGFWTMSARYWKMGMMELYRSVSKGAFVRSLQKLVPEIRDEHLVKGNAGVRAQEVERSWPHDGRLPHHRDAERRTRAECAFAGRHGPRLR